MIELGRQCREEVMGGYYHVIARGNNREYIFRKDIDKGYFLKLLNESRKMMRFKLLGYVLMDNHYHLMIQTADTKLQKIMHQINNQYSKYFNGIYERCGHVFQERYQSLLIRDELYLIKVLAYIHQNPVKANMCNKVEEYSWSSDKFYRRKSSGFIETKLILEMIDKGFRGKDMNYDKIMREIEATGYEKLNSIGEKAYEIMMKNSRVSNNKPSLNEILTETVIDDEIREKILTGARGSKLREYKLEYAKKAKAYGYTLREIGASIGQSGNSIWKLFQSE